MHRRLAVFIVLAALSADAGAANDDPQLEITPFGAYHFGGSFGIQGTDAAYDLGESSAFGLIVNIRDRSNTQWEILYSHQRADAKRNDVTASAPSVDIDIDIVQIGGMVQGRGESVRPYLAATIGGTRIEAHTNGTDSDTFVSGSIGVGLRLRPNERLGLRLEARAYGTLTNADTDLFCQTGPDFNVCAVRVDGDLLGQIGTFAGIVYRF